MSSIEPVDFEAIEREERPQAKRLAEFLSVQHPGARALDLGCGPGLYVEEMRAQGIDAFGIDNDPRMVPGPTLLRQDITSSQPGGVYDIVVSLEVGEHIAHSLSGRYVRFIDMTDCRIVYFSAARPGQGGHGHINCQPKAYWVERFHSYGFWLNPDRTDVWLDFMRQGYHMGWLTQNGMVFERG